MPKKPLSPKQRRFVAEYLKDQNGTQAAIRAGYSKKTAQEQSSRLLLKAMVRSAIDARLAKVESRCEVTAERIIAELGRVAFSDVGSLYAKDGTLRPIAEWPEDARRAVSGIDSEELFEGFGSERKRVGTTIKVRLWNKVPALELLGKHKQLFDEASPLSGVPMVINIVPAHNLSAADKGH